VAGINLFSNDDNKIYFLKKFSEYLNPVLDVYTWCLLPNHFHFLVQIKKESKWNITEKESIGLQQGLLSETGIVSRRFKNFFIAYSQAYKKQQNINTNVFSQHFKHPRINKDEYFTQVIYYIHLNPLHHGIIKDWQQYPWSSYKKIIRQWSSYSQYAEVVKWFGGIERFIKYHEGSQGKYNCDFDD
jgi:REP element-mobilizing transposase RayT